MRRFAWVLPVLAFVASQPIAAAATVRRVEFDQPVTAATVQRIVQAVDDARAQGDALIFLRLDTPGGDLESMESAIKSMLASPVPIVAWVGPSGARAASAGFFLLLAADVAAMAPGTRTGAASVVYAMGESKDDDVMLRKITNDMAAAGRSIAEHRGRPLDEVEEAIRSAEAFTDARALEAGLVDLVARDPADLMSRLDGREVRRLDGRTTVLDLGEYTFVESEFGFTQRFTEVLATPVVAFFLLLVGLGGLYIELTNPGLILPGVLGALCLLLFAFSARMLPFSVIGILLILLGIIMFVLEVKVTSYGLLGIGGTVCVVLGSLMLFPGPVPELRLPLPVVLPASLTFAAFCAIAVRLAIRAQQAPVATGSEGLFGATGTVTDALDPHGRVFVHGEIWNASSRGNPIRKGTRVRVVAVEDMTLRVEPLEEEPPSGSRA
jgi:membrane-bound serine protease (ClpP class)